MATKGWISFRFDWLSKIPPFDGIAMRKSLLSKINEIQDVHFGDDVLTGPARIPFEKLQTSVAMDKLKTVVTWLLEQLKNEVEALDSSSDT